MTIAISIDRVLEDIYAYSALEFFGGAHRPSVLGRQQAPALRNIARAEAVRVAYELPCASGVDDTDADILTYTIAVADTYPTGHWADLPRAIQTVVVYGVLAMTYSACDMDICRHFSALQAEAITRIAHRTGAGGAPGFIRPSRA